MSELHSIETVGSKRSSLAAGKLTEALRRKDDRETNQGTEDRTREEGDTGGSKVQLPKPVSSLGDNNSLPYRVKTRRHCETVVRWWCSKNRSLCEYAASTLTEARPHHHLFILQFAEFTSSHRRRRLGRRSVCVCLCVVGDD